MNTVGYPDGLAASKKGRGRHRGRTWARVLGCVVALTVLIIFVVFPLTPSLDLWNENVQVNTARHLITESFLIRNDGLVGEKIVAADLDAPGIRVVRTNASVVISTRGHAWVSVTYRVTDCKAAVAAETGAPFPMNLRLERWWGIHTVTVEDHGEDSPGPFDICS